MTIYSKASIVAAYQRTRDAGIDHEQAILAVAQAMNQDAAEVANVVAEQETADAS